MTMVTQVDTPTRVARRARTPRDTSVAALRLIGLAVLSVGWYLAAWRSPVVASPTEAVSGLIEAFHHGLATDIAWTARTTAVGYVIAATAGVAVGVLLGLSTPFRQVFAEPLYGLASVPKLIIYPVLIALFGIGAAAESSFVVAGTFFLIVFQTLVGVRELPGVYQKVSRVFRVSRWHRFTKIVLPGAAPSILTGMRVGLNMALVHGVLASMVVGNVGVGTRIWVAYRDQDYAGLYGLVLVITATGIAGNALLWYVESKISRGR